MIIFNQETRSFATAKTEDNDIQSPAFGMLSLSIRTRGKTRDRKGRPRYKKVTYKVPLSKGSMDKRGALNALAKEMNSGQFNGKLSAKKLRFIIQAFKQ